MQIVNIHRERPLAYLVDDDASVRLQAAAALGERYEVEEFASGAELLEGMERRTPDIILLDVVMPGLDGYATCRALRDREDGEFVPVLMMTGLDDDRSMERAFEVGATDFITKPINWPLLEHRVRYILRASDTLNRLRFEESKNRALLDAMPDTVLRVRSDGRILEATGGRGAVESLPTQEWVTRMLHDIVPEVASRLQREMDKCLARPGSARVVEVSLGDGSAARDYEVRTSSCSADEALVVFRDVTERKRGEREIRRRAYHDDLTGLPNRSFFMEILDRALRSAQRSGLTLATLFVDLDGFKTINDSLGHHFGDELLREASQRMGECLRSGDWVGRPDRREDGDAARLARLGGDEFCVLLPGLREGSAAASVARRILAALSVPFVFDGHEVHLTASIGIALWPDDSASADQLLRHADSAMYHAKARRSGSFEFYTTSIGEGAERRLEVEVHLRRALERRQLELHYQPLVELESGRVVGAEALLRWQHPDLGQISPLEFVPIAERTGLIGEIGDWVLRAACREAATWRELSGESLVVSVNVSGVQFRRPDFVQSVNGAIHQSGLDPSRLILELTETTLMREPQVVADSMRRLRKEGIRFAVDDFGTGYSSLSYVRDLPLDAIKLDGSFLRGIPGRRQSRAIATAVLGMAHGLDLSVVAEGVETEEQRRFLIDLGYRVGQGHLFNEAMPGADFRRVLATLAAGVSSA